jgi:TRAP-type C4-dicarboxylate transport system permease small subunit
MIVYRWLLGIAQVGVVCIATLLVTLVSAEIVMRYGVNAPLSWGYDLTTLLFSWLLMLALPLAINGGREPTPIPPTWLARIGLLSQSMILVLLGWIGLTRSLLSYRNGTVSSALAELPQVWYDAAIPCGCLLATLVILCRFAAAGKARS